MRACPATEGLEHGVIADKYYEPPLINVIKFACNGCPEKVIKVTEMCQGCLAHPCQEVCPKHAISFRNGKSHIDQSLCVKCGRCVNSCPYSAIVKTERPCAAACGMGAIHSDEHGRAEIDYDKCVSCGMCLVNCPFGAIVDKGQIFQLIQSIKRGDEVIAIVAPAFVSQFGPDMTPCQAEGSHAASWALPMWQRSPSALTCAPSMRLRTSCEEVPDQDPLHGHLLLPGLERNGQEAVPRAGRVHQHGYDPDGPDRPPAEEGEARGPYLLRRPLRRQEAGGQPPLRPQRGRLRADLRGTDGPVRG